MRFQLLHDMFFMHSYVCPLVLLASLPVVFSSGRYLQFCLLQKLKPLFEGFVPFIVCLVSETLCGGAISIALGATGAPCLGAKDSFMLPC